MDNSVYRKSSDKCELIITASLHKLFPCDLERLPTALLIGNSQNFTNKELDEIFIMAVDLGLVSVMFWGEGGLEQEDFIDFKIETSEQDLTHIITTAYDDSIEDLAYFFINTTYFNADDRPYRYIAILKGESSEVNTLSESIIALFEEI